MIYLIEAQAHDGSGIVTLRFSTTGYVTRPGDNPPNTYYEPRIIQPGNYERYAFGQGSTSGEARVGAGEVVLANPDGELDGLIDYAWDGYPLTILALDDVDAPFSSAATMFRGTVEQAEFSWRQVTLRIRDRLAELREPIQQETYAGTTTAGGMDQAEGGPDDLKGQPKPLLFGRARNIPAVPANVFDLIYQVSSRPLSSVDAVYDRGVKLTATSDHASIAALRGATLSPGQYATARSLGLIRLGGTPAGQVTVDAAGEAPPVRANLLRYSQELGVSVWIGGPAVAVQQGAALAPDGTMTANLLTWNATGSTYQPVSGVAPSSVYTFSYWVKLGTKAVNRFSIYDTTHSAFIVPSTVMGQGVNASNWTRVAVTFTTPPGCTSVRVYPDRRESWDTTLGTIYIWGAQLEAGDRPTDYIPTTTAPATNAADSVVAGSVVRGILTGALGAEPDVDFRDEDFQLLSLQTRAPVGVWIGTQPETILSVVNTLLSSVGAYIAPDRLGVFRVGRVTAPAGEPVAVYTEAEIIEHRAGTERVATNDAGRGVPAHRVTVRYGRNYAVANANALAGAVTPEYQAFAAQEYRSAVAESPAVKARHRLSPELMFDTAIVAQTDAQAEANRRLALYSVRRDRFRIRIKSEFAAGIDLGSVVLLDVDRFGLAGGKLCIVLGMEEDFATGMTTLETYG